jgi:hypothetical protein
MHVSSLTEVDLQMAFIIVAGICACLYFLFLCFMVFQVFRNISGKRSSLPAMSKARRLHYEVCVFEYTFVHLKLCYRTVPVKSLDTPTHSIVFLYFLLFSTL